MNAECLEKIRRLGVNAGSRKRIVGAFWRRQTQDVYTEEYRSALLQRYPAGLIDRDEIQALLTSWSKAAPRVYL